MLQVEGLQDMEAGSHIVKRKESAKHPGRYTFESSINVRRGLWSGNGPLGKSFPVIAYAARRVLSLHATSCAPERNWSHWGRLNRKDRSSLGIKRAEQLIFVSGAAKIANKQIKSAVQGKSAEMLEEEFLCAEVDDSKFGTTLADCVLIEEVAEGEDE